MYVGKNMYVGNSDYHVVSSAMGISAGTSQDYETCLSYYSLFDLLHAVLLFQALAVLLKD